MARYAVVDEACDSGVGVLFYCFQDFVWCAFCILAYFIRKYKWTADKAWQLLKMKKQNLTMDPVILQSLDRLAERGLVIWLSPPGRGRMLTHGLLPEEKLEKVRRELGLAMAAAAHAAPAADASIDDEPELNKPAAGAERAAATSPPVAPVPSTAEFERRIADLEREVAALHTRLKTLEDALG
jgi:hypothetical protein